MNGYVYVASLSKAFYKAAVNSAISLKDFYPESNITLFTHPEFVEDRDRKIFDNIITDIPYNIRAKMYGMANTPYDTTLYIDADTEIRSPRIKDVFDIIKDNDIMFTKIVPHVSKDRRVDNNNELTYHGGIILYNNKKLTIELIHNWFKLFQYQKECKWEESFFKNFDKGMKPWDQFTIWYLLHEDKRFTEIKHALFPNGGHEYNFIYLLENSSDKNNKPYLELEQIIYHYTIPQDKINAGHIRNKQ